MYYTTFIKKNLKNITALRTNKELAMKAILNRKEFQEDMIELIYRPKITKVLEDTEVFRNRNEAYISKAKVVFRRMDKMINEFKETNPKPIEEYYTEFRIPKASGGTRKITAPTDELKTLLSNLSDMFRQTNVLEHEVAFAYVPKRSIVDALTVHQANNSHWFLKVDLKGFFPSFTKEFIIETLNRLYPICYVEDEVLRHVVEVSLYQGGLPQGSPLSPLLSNLCMTIFDHELDAELRLHDKQHYVYTRYADDIIISSRYEFNYNDIIEVINKVLNKHASVHKINQSKTRYGSRSGSNWNLGLMLNKDNKITIGHKKKRRLKATIFSFLKDYKEGQPWDLIETQEFIGLLEYAKQIEPAYWKELIKRKENTVGVTLKQVVDSIYS